MRGLLRKAIAFRIVEQISVWLSHLVTYLNEKPFVAYATSGVVPCGVRATNFHMSSLDVPTDSGYDVGKRISKAIVEEVLYSRSSFSLLAVKKEVCVPYPYAYFPK